MSQELQNPRKWRYTWEAQSHLPLLKLFIFSPQTNPIYHCSHLNVDLKFEKSLVILTWKNDDDFPNSISLFVPLPRVLVDLDSPLNFKVSGDHIEVKIPLLLPVDHPIVCNFVSELNNVDEFGACSSSDGFLQPLSMDSDFKDLSSKGEIDFYCRNCAFKLTKRSVRCLVDLPSVNWTDVADNWFGTCCCSFGGISEKLVAKYVESYRCVEGKCLLTVAAVILHKDDIVGFKSLEAELIQSGGNKGFIDIVSNHRKDSSAKLDAKHPPAKDISMNGEPAESDEDNKEKLSCAPPMVGFTTDAQSAHDCCEHSALESSLKDLHISVPAALQAGQKSFLNCYLGNSFVFKLDGLSKDIEWIDFACPNCSCTLGAYPCSDGSVPLDGGIRLFKCYVSISPVHLSDDLFSKYTLERMFACQLLESAKDELSFRTVVKDLKLKSSMLHIVLLNPNSWCCTGFCLEGNAEPTVKINLHPVVKVLVSHGNDNSDTRVRLTQEWETKADEMHMLPHVINDLIKFINEATYAFPPSFSSSEGFLLASIPR